MEEKILGRKVKDVVTGITGIATARCVYLNDCVQYAITQKKITGKVKEEDFWVDEEQIKILDSKHIFESIKKTITVTTKTGGGNRSHPRL